MRHRLPGLAAEKLPKFGVEAMWVYHPLVSPAAGADLQARRVELIAWTVDDAAADAEAGRAAASTASAPTTPASSPASSAEWSIKGSIDPLIDHSPDLAGGVEVQQAGEALAVAGDPAVGAFGRPREAAEEGGERPAARQQGRQRRGGGARRAQLAFGRDQVPGVEPLRLGERCQQSLALLALDLDRPQPAAIPGEDLVEGPAAESAVAVVEDRRLSIRSGQLTKTMMTESAWAE